MLRPPSGSNATYIIRPCKTCGEVYICGEPLLVFINGDGTRMYSEYCAACKAQAEAH